MNLIALTLTNVEIEIPARRTPSVEILMEATSASVIKVSRVIFAKTLMSVPKPILVMQMQRV